ncbi:MAG TPA: sodium:proton antiporter [Longimicrobiales bacterium]|nr:sodium:proton antiporter [Longimicrobiales bacterium]
MQLDNPALTVALALAAGVLAQSLARHLRVPGIVLLLVAGILLGPDGLELVRPRTLGASLEVLVGLSVAVILFDGGLNLNLGRLRREGAVIRRLITMGAAVTAIGGTLAARVGMGWPWPVAILFGTLVIVTGPTVITPLLRRIRVTRGVETALEAEGVLIDPVGAIVAVVALEIVLAGTLGGAAHGLVGLTSRLALGALAGTLAGLLIGGVLRYGRVVPDGYENIFTLSIVLAVFEASDAIQPESGILAATVAGLVVGNLESRTSRELREFKEQLTTLFVGMLFVLLAADVRLREVGALGWRGVAVVALLIAVVRPLDVLVSTWRSGFSARERAFMCWIGPRGIVAAAVASIFAERLADNGSPYGAELQALVFLVIAVTVVLQGSTGGILAAILGLRRPSNQGYALVGANALGRAIARALARAGDEVVLIDSNPREAEAAAAEGFRVLHGNANEETILELADVEGRRGLLAVTPNEGANLLLGERVRTHARSVAALVAIAQGKAAVTPRRAREVGVHLLFGGPIGLTEWIAALEHGEAELQAWKYAGSEARFPERPGTTDGDARTPLPLVHWRGRVATPVSDATTVRRGDVVVFAVPTDPRAAGPLALGLGEWVVEETPAMREIEAVDGRGAVVVATSAAGTHEGGEGG